MRLVKENLYEIIKLYINQIGILIFSAFLYSAISNVNEEPLATNLLTAVSVFAILFYFVLIYYVVWEIGAKDKIRIDGGRYDAPKAKGFLMGLFANVLNIVLASITLLFLIIYASGGTGVTDVLGVFDMIMRFHGSMYMGLIRGITPAEVVEEGINVSDCIAETTLFLIIPLISCAVTHLAYYLGRRDKKLLGGKRKKQ